MRVEGRRIAVSLALFAAIMIVGGWPWPTLSQVFSAGYSRVVNLLVFDRMTFGRGGHARLAPLGDATATPGDHVAADTAVVLTVAGYRGEIGMGLSLRRDAYLPLLIVVAVVLAAPGTAREKSRRLLVGVALAFAYTAAAIWLLVLWRFALEVRGVYQLSPPAKGAIDLAHRMLLLPPGNRFVVPLAIGLGLVWWRRPRPQVLAA